MAIIYNHAQIGVVDTNGDVNVVYPKNYGDDVFVEQGENTYLKDNNITTAQKLAESVGTDLASTMSNVETNTTDISSLKEDAAKAAVDFSYSDSKFKLLDKAGNVIREATIEGGGGASTVLTVTTDITGLYGQKVVANIGSVEVVEKEINEYGTATLNLNFIGEYTVSCGQYTTTITNPAIGTVLSLEFNSTKVHFTTNIEELFGTTLKAVHDDGKETIQIAIGSDGTCVIPLLYTGSYTITAGDFSVVVGNSSMGSEINTNVLGTVLNITTDDESFLGQPVSITHDGGKQTIAKTFTSDGKASCVLAYTGTYTVSCLGYDSTIECTEVGGSDLSIKIAGIKIYGFHINGSESNPANMITYPSDVLNAGFTPMKMNYSTGKMDYGSWKEVLDEWLMPKPCMLKYNGTVDYYLNPDDYTKKADGSSSDIANDSYAGNAMVEFGKNNKKIWYKVVPDANSSDATSGTVYIADGKADDDYVDYAFHGTDGESHDHFYMSIYQGSNVSNRLRSLSGKTNLNSQTASTEISYAKANNTGSNEIWNIEKTADFMLVNYLLLLLGRNYDTQTQFGRGANNRGSSGIGNCLTTGTMNSKGMFWGANDNTSGVKIFGIENYYGNQWQRVNGMIAINGKLYMKLTYGTEDGSTVSGYNLTGSGYINTNISLPTSGYLIKQKITKYGLIPLTSGGSDSTYVTDYWWLNSSGTMFLLRGGDCRSGSDVGAFCLYLHYAASDSSWSLGARLSCLTLS